MAENALPDLKARMVLDDSTASAVVTRFMQLLKSAGGEGEQAGLKVSVSIGKVGTEAEKSESKVKALLEGLKKVGEASVRVGEVGVGHAEGGLFGGLTEISGALNLPMLGAVSGITGLLGGLESLTQKTADYSSAVLRNSELLGLNTGQYQALSRAANQFGVEEIDFTRTIARFQRNIEDGGTALNQMGLSLKSVGITTTDTGTALTELSAYLERTTDAAQRNAVGLALLGRNGIALTEILSKGPAFLQEYQRELQSYGLILSDTDLRTGALAKTTHDQFQLALQGIEMQVGTQLEGAFAGLWETLVKMAGGSDQLFRKIGQGIASVVGWIASLMQGLFGVQVNMKTLDETATSATAALAGMSASSNDATSSSDTLSDSVNRQKDAIDALRQSTQSQTDAIDDQVKNLQAQQSAYEQNTQAQVDAIRQREQAVQDQMRDQELLQQLQDETHQSYLSQLQDELDALTQTQDDRRHGNESLVDYERRLEEQSLRGKIKDEENRRATEKTTQDLALQRLKEQDQAEVDALTAQKQREKDQTQAEIDELQARKTALQRHLQQEEDAYTRSQDNLKGMAGSTTAAMSGDFANLTGNVGKDAATMQGNVDKALGTVDLHFSQTAFTIGQKIHDLFTDPGGTLGATASELGKELGSSIVGGIMSSLLGPQGILGGAGQGLNFIRAQASGDAAQIVQQAIALINQATTIDEINEIGQAAAASNVLNSSEMQQIQAAANARAAWLYQYGGAGGGVGGGGGGSSHRQHGGDIEPGRVYQVGEDGPEPFVSSLPGYVLSRQDAMEAYTRTMQRGPGGILSHGGGVGSFEEGGATHVTSNFYGPVADMVVARRVVDEQERELRRRGIIHRQPAFG